MADLISMLAAVAGSGGGADPNFNQTVLLLHGDGTNGAQNNTFLDSSTNNFTITRNGNTTQGTFSPFSVGAGEWSNYFDGSGDFLDIGSAANWKFLHDGSSWTIEFSVYHTSTAAQTVCGTTAGSAQVGFICGLNSFAANEVAIQFFRGSSPTGVTSFRSNAALTINQWNHVAITFDTSGKTCTFYINGVQQGSSSDTGFAYSASNPSNTLRVGSFVFSSPSSGDFLIGYLSNLRISSTVRTGLTTVPTTPYTNDANTSLLTCQSNRFVDNSTNAFAITRNGDVKVTPFSPFAPTAAYSAGTNGGSGYFDGTGDYLNFTEFSSATDFTCECWFYRGPDVPTRHTLFGGNRTISNSRNCQLAVSNGGAIMVILNDAVVTNFNDVGGNVVPRDSWNHIAYVRSSTTISVFVNGTRIATGTSSATLYVTQVGAYIDALGAAVCNGYISNARVTNTAVYDPSQTTLTVPTAPLTAISGTSLLLNFTNAGIFDNTGKNNLETVGNAQIDTTTKKYGTGSMEFDGSGDYLAAPASLNFDFGTADFTIECWAYIAANSAQDGDGNRVANLFVVSSGANIAAIFGISGNSTTTGTGLFLFKFIGSSTNRSVATTITQGVWNHLAVCRNGTNLRFFVNGTQAGSTITDSTSWGSSAYPSYVGGNPNSASYLQYLNGYIDDLRITKGVARYTANFVPPTAAFPNE